MSNQIKIPIVVFMVVLAAKILLVMMGRKKKEDTEILVLWLLIATVTSLVHSFYVLVLVLIIIKVTYLRNDLGKNVVAFFALWAVIPFHFIIHFPLPSVPLMNATYQRMAFVIWILPLLPKLLDQARMKERRVFFDVPVLYLIAMGIFVAFSEHVGYPITIITSIKEVMQLFMDMVIPYFLIVLWADTWAKLKRVLFAFLLAGIVLSTFGVFEAVFSWNVFTELVFREMIPVSETDKYRAFLRSKAAFPESIAFGIYILITLGIALAVMFRDKKNMMGKLVVVGAMLAALYATQSRGDQIAAVLLLSLYFFFKMQSSSRFILLIFMAIVFSVAGYTYKQQSPAGAGTDLDEVDEHGTFDYRKRLFETELALIPKHPFFGNTTYMKEPSMEALRQGEGIIDPVNTYLTIAVERGLVTLFFFMFFILRSVRACLSYVKYGYAVNNQVWVNLGAALTATVFALSVALIFTSFADTNPPVFWFVMGIARAMQLNLNKMREISRGKDEYDLGYA
ncbi:MAG TPA: hypothetical protein EYH06_04925 [Chromatiales bacterium]|nr:hypothetical protein [Thiotrichales bacterium]HIP67920.1 hypothetical protein [Chromatiales bacterium]